MGRNLKILIIIFSFTVLYGIYYWAIPAVINSVEKTEQIEQMILKETGFKVSVKNPSLKMGIIPSVWIRAEDFSILNDDGTKALSVNKPCINISIFPLLLKNLSIKYFSADNISASFVLDKDTKIKLGQYALEQQSNLPLRLIHIHGHLNSYNLNLMDKIQQKKINIDGKYLIIKEFTSDNRLNLSTIADITTGKKKASIKTDLDLKLPLNNLSDDADDISGHIANLDLADFSVYAKTLSKNKIKSLSGIVNFTANTVIKADKHKQLKTNLFISNLGIFNDDLKSSIQHKGKLEIKTDINTLKNGIDINEMKITGNGINAFVRGTVTGLNYRIPILDLKVTLNKSKAENIIQLLPGEPDLCPDINLLLLKKAGFWADATGNLDIKGKTDFPEVKGSILLSNAYMVKPIPNAEKAVIKLSFNGNNVDLDVNVPTSRTQYVTVKGPIELYKEKRGDLKITSTDNVDLKTAQIVLNPLHDILNFDIGPVPIMDIKGRGGINLHVIGSRQNPHGWGQFKFNNATVSFLDIHNMVMKNGSGTLDFDNQNTVFQTNSASLHGKPVSVSGTCSLTGVLDFNVNANRQDLGNLLKIIKTSPMLADIQKLTEKLEAGSGTANLKLNLTGKVNDPKDIVFNKNLFAKGTVQLLSNTIKIKDVPSEITKVSGIVNFNNLDTDINIKSNIKNSQIKITGNMNEKTGDLKIVSDMFNIGDAISTLPKNLKIPYKADLATINTSFNARYKGSLQNIDPDNISVKGKIYSNKGAKSTIITDNSPFELYKSAFKLTSVKGTFKKSPYNISLNISDIFNKSRVVNGNCQINSLDLNLINDDALKFLLPPQSAKELKSIDFTNGKINLTAHVRNNNLSAYTQLDDVSMFYEPKNLKLTVNSGNIILRNDILQLNKINAKLGQMPVFADGKISSIFKKPNLNLYINAKPTQEFLDQFFNNNALYPVKLKGDSILTSKITGTANNLNAKSVFNMAENSTLYYMGASIGDVENPVKITVDSTYSPDRIKLNNFQYDKIISSQNNKPYVKPQLNASGAISMLPGNNVRFNNFKIKTQTPTDAKIFNIIFRKPFMKQGVFTSDLVLNGTSLNPKIIGTLNITSIDIPFFDSTIRDINLNFEHDKITAASRGTVLTNDVYIDAVIKNELIPPYILQDLKVKLADLNINKITDTMRDIEADATRNPIITSQSTQNFDISQLIIQKAIITADKIKVKNIKADNFKADLSLDREGLLNIKNFKFDIAEGNVLGHFTHNLKNHKTNLNINLDRANALIMSEALFDLKGQVYGLVNGNFNLNCTGDSQENCFKTLSGEGSFKIADGRMPKLGSLEYLLKAGNLLKGGFTGLSINSLIDLVTPLKTGNFESISGHIHLTDGTADDINIYSSGHDLNMYMTGSYNVVSSIADMKIYGSLSKNITTVFGKIKNASLNTLFNTIPGINDSTEKLLLQEDIAKIPNIKDATDIYRIFAVDINGDINGVDYVRSFQWVK